MISGQSDIEKGKGELVIFLLDSKLYGRVDVVEIA